jgi:hypothetical protein
MRLPPRALLINETPDLAIPKARSGLRMFRVKSLAVDSPVDWRVVELQFRAGTESERPRPDSRLGR